MSDEVFKMDEADPLTRKISERLGSRQQKIERMENWERRGGARQHKMHPALLLAIAACVAAMVIMWPRQDSSTLEQLGIGAPEMTSFRAADPAAERIKKLIGAERYEEALEQTQKALKNSDLAIYELENVPEIWSDEEEMAYEDELERMKNSELRWTCIYLLVQTGNSREAKRELNTYLKHPEFCEHEAEARALLKQIKKK